MRNRIKRTIRNSEQIRKLIENDKRFVPVNNRIFDDFYEQEFIEYHPCHQEPETMRSSLCGKYEHLKMTELDLIVFIFLQLINYNKIAMYPHEIAKYLGCSNKALITSLNKLERMKGVINTRPIHTQEMKKIDERRFSWEGVTKREYDENSVRLITEKTFRAHLLVDEGIATTRKMSEWYVNFETDWEDCSSKKETKWKMINFFFVTIKDFDLLTKGLLSRPAFITYLYLIRRDSMGEHGIYMRDSYIADKLQIKSLSTVRTYLDELESMGLIKTFKPQNYNAKLEKYEEPSRIFKPYYNYAALAECKGKLQSDGDYQTMEEVNLSNFELNFSNMEVDFLN